MVLVGGSQMIVSPRTARRCGFKCGCCQLFGPQPRQRDAERRLLKRRERQAVRRQIEKEI